MEITRLTVHELLELLEKKEITREQILQAYADRIKEKDSRGNFYNLQLYL